MNDHRSLELFFELFGDLPRQGPGDVESTRRAFELVTPLDATSRVLDLGCGSGAQTFALAAVTPAQILAIDSHPPFIARLNDTARMLGLADRVHGRVGDMATPDVPPGSVDLDLGRGLHLQHRIRAGARLVPAPAETRRARGRDGGLLVDAGPARALPRVLERRIPGDRRRRCVPGENQIVRLLGRRAFRAARLVVVDRLLQAAAGGDRAIPSEVRGDGEALAVAEASEREITIWREYRDCYGYVFFVMRS